MGLAISTAPTKTNMTFLGKTTLAAAAQTISVTTTGTTFLVLCRLKNAINSENAISLYVNGDTTDAHYYNQEQTFDDTSLGAHRKNNSILGYLGASANAVYQLWIRKTPDGYMSAENIDSYSASSGIRTEMINLAKTNATIAGDITQITISHDTLNGFAIGSVVEVWAITNT